MSSAAKSRNFLRRDEDEEETTAGAAPPASKVNGNQSKANTPEKTPCQPPAKSLLSFADDDEESPFSLPPSKQPSAHTFTSAKHRIVPKSSSSFPSNFQPPPGLYTKEALLELEKNTKTLKLQKNTKTLATPEPPSIVILKGLIKAVSSTDSATTGRIHDFGNDERDDLREGIPIADERDDLREGVIPIAKRKRLREGKAPSAAIGHGEGEGEEVEGSDDKDEEEEQVRKGLGKRLDDGIGSNNVSGASSVRPSSGLQPSFVHPSTQAQAEQAREALNENENLTRVKESHGRTMISLEKTKENYSSSLLSATNLKNYLAASDEKSHFMRNLRKYVSVIREFLQHKAPFIGELEEQMQKLHEERARVRTERRAAYNDDEISEIEQAIIAAHKGKAVIAATVELDEFGRDINFQKRMVITRRAEARLKRRAKAELKRKSALETDTMEGELSTDQSDSESTTYNRISHNRYLLAAADKIFSDAAEEYSQFSIVVERFKKWKKEYAWTYHDAYMSLSLPSIFSPYVRLELLKWDPLHKEADFVYMKWHYLLFNYGIPEDETEINEDSDANIIPVLVEKLAIPILHHRLCYCFDPFSTRETKFAVSSMNLVTGYVDLSSSALGDLVAVLRDRLDKAVAELMVPTWSQVEMKSVPNAARFAAYRFGTCVRLMRNICLWNGILAMPVLEKIALDELLCGKVLPHLHSIRSNVHDAITRTERVIASLYGVWTGPSVAGDQRKLQPLVEYLLLIGKTLEKKRDADSDKLFRRLRKMLVEMNEYDHARQVSRTFNITLSDIKAVLDMDTLSKPKTRDRSTRTETPPLGWVKLNTDWSYLTSRRTVAAGGAIKDASGQWIVGFAVKLGAMNPLAAEMMGLREGLRIAWERRFEKIEVECDSRNVVDLIKEETWDDHPLGDIIEDCRKLIRKPWTCKVDHISRSANSVADKLARIGQEMEEEVMIWEP